MRILVGGECTPSARPRASGAGARLPRHRRRAMIARSSRGERRVAIETRLFVVGCPRSGTTWVRSLLAERPEVATHDHESNLFTRYLARLEDDWEGERAQHARGQNPYALLG